MPDTTDITPEQAAAILGRKGGKKATGDKKRRAGEHYSKVMPAVRIKTAIARNCMQYFGGHDFRKGEFGVRCIYCNTPKPLETQKQKP